MSSELCMHSRVSVSPRLSLGRRGCVQSFVAFVLALDTHGAAMQSPHPKHFCTKSGAKAAKVNPLPRLGTRVKPGVSFERSRASRVVEGVKCVEHLGPHE
eukprot:1061061-Prymnesium_polylepis.1